MQSITADPYEAITRWYKRRFSVLWSHVPELVAIRAGLREATQLSLEPARFAREQARLEDFCHRAGLALQSYLRRGMVKVLISARAIPNLDPTDEQRLGELFGYPACCVRRFASHQAQPLEPFINHMTALLGGRDRVDFRLNLLLSCTTLHLVRHFPCHLGCQSTLEQARRLLEAMERLNPRLHRQILRHCRAPALYLDVCGAAVFFQGERLNDRVRYRSCHCPVQPRGLLALSMNASVSDCDLVDELVQTLRLGDELICRPNELLILQRGQWLATFPRPSHLAWQLISFV